MTGSGNTLTFNTTTINVEPGLLKNWVIVNVTSTTEGFASVTVVPGAGYGIQPGPGSGSSTQVNFKVAEPCAVDPTTFELGGAVVNITCGAADTDNDGVPDVDDNCPLVANADQIDQDLDGFGNVCDADLDGDGVANLDDNCPGIENTMQEDADGDDIGDACEDDDDNDTVPDLVDNCPLVANIDQADSDRDLIGDACDDDDDNDGVLDEVDNCPVIFNPLQSDFGGECGGDADDDAVVNALDLCPSSPLGQPVDLDGCTGAQSIGLVCQRENFVQHGQYVSCVAHAANDAVDEGLMSPKEKARFVKEAAKKQ